MPLFKFHCQGCGRDFVLFRRLSEVDDRPVCPECGGRDLDGPSAEEGQAPPAAAPACGPVKQS